VTRSIRLAALTAVTSMVAGLCLPGTAHAADTETTLTAAQMVSALTSVAVASTTAAENGWKITQTMKSSSGSGTVAYVIDPAAGVVSEQVDLGGETGRRYAVHHKGTYESLSTRAARATVKMMNRPAVRYVFKPAAKLDFDGYVDGEGVRPATILTRDVSYPGTRTTHDDGSADYSFSPENGVTVTYEVAPTGVLSSAWASIGTVTATLTLEYGAQHVTLPAASATINSVVLARGEAYLSMAATVKQVAGNGAASARKAAAGGTVKAGSVRKVLRQLAAGANWRAGSAMVRVKDVRNGARVYATNPWTHQTVAYTVKASGTKVTVSKVI
jgi:hypothetical protein